MPTAGWLFLGWSEDVIGSESTAQILVNVHVRFINPVKFFREEDEETYKCINTKAGDKAIVIGIEYESVDNGLLSRRLR